MRSSCLFILVLMLPFSLVKSQTIVNGGDVSGVWNMAGSPYQIFGEINIPAGQTLTIQPGVRVHFQGHHRFFVYGTLLAIGTANDSIFFTVDNDTIEWCGIEFNNPQQTSDRSLIEYCVIEHSYAYSGLSWPYTSNYDVGGGIMAELGNLTIRNSAIRHNKALIGAGIRSRLNTVVENTSFTNNEALGKDIVSIESGVELSGCLIAGNRASENIVRINQYVLFVNNTISGNILDSSGIAVAMVFGNPDLVNNIFYGNNIRTIHVTGGSYPRFYNCNIEGGKNSLFAYDPNYKGEFDGIYENNIDCPPDFVDAAHDNYQIGAHSPCIDAGSQTDWNPSLLTDLMGEPRIADNQGHRVDIGAYEYQGDPLNRIPYVQDTTTIYKLKALTRKIRIPFYDADSQDNHLIDIQVDHDSVTAALFSSTSSSFSFSIESSPGWIGECMLHVIIRDDSGAANDSCSVSIPIIVGNQYKGRIEYDESFGDTVEVVGDIFIDDFGSLTVPQGTFVQFQDHFKITVTGELQVLGTENNRVKFDIVDSIAQKHDDLGNYCGWGGIEMFYLNPAEPMTLKYFDLNNTGFNRDFNVEQGTLTMVGCSNILLDHCRFSSNQCVYNGERNAGTKMDECSGIEIRNSEFTDCFAKGVYKGTYVWGYNSDFEMDSCVIHDTPIQGPAALETNGGNVTIRNSEFYNNQMLMLSIGTRDNDVSIIENNYFHDNYGGSIKCEDGNLIRNNIFLRTVAAGGVIGCRGNSDIIGNLFAYNDNQLYNVGDFMGIAISIRGDANVINNTIVKNFNRAKGGAISVEYASPYIVNNILWDNDKEGIYWYNGGWVSDPTIENNVVKGGYVDYNYNFGWDPYFRLNDSLDYQLTDSSQCINKAITDADVFSRLLPLDLSGNPRYDTVNHQLDIGAYEFQGPFELPDTVTSIANATSQIDIEIYPNPVSEELNIECSSEILEYSILNLHGVIVKHGYSNLRIYVGDLTEGQYILSITSRLGITRQLFMKL